MKRFLIVISAVFAALISSGQSINKAQIPNGDFETWTYDGANLPNNFNSFQTADGKYASLAYDEDNRQVSRSTDIRPGSSGRYSCKIWTRVINAVVVKIVAQGNLTTGRVHAGSMSAKSDNNYMYTYRGGYTTNKGVQNPCFMNFTSIPDSIAVWVKFNSDGSDKDHPYAFFNATIHDDCEYIQGDNNSNLSSHVVAFAEKLFTRTSGRWVRYAAPFKRGISNNPKYILMCFATNSYHGGGAKGDEMYIDDIEMIYRSRYVLSVSASCGWASLCLDFNAKIPEGAKVFVATGMKAGYVSLRELPAGATIPAGCGVIVESSKSSLTFEQSSDTPCKVDDNILSGVTASASVSDSYDYYVLSGDGTTPSRASFALFKGTILSANRSFIKIEK